MPEHFNGQPTRIRTLIFIRRSGAGVQWAGCCSSLFCFLQVTDFSVQHADRGVPLVALAHRPRLRQIHLVQNTLLCTFLAAPYVHNRCLRMLSAGSDASTLRRSMHLKRSSSPWKSKFLVGRGVPKKTKFRLRWEPVAFLQAGFGDKTFDQLHA